MQKQKTNKLEPQLQLKRIAAVVTLAVAASTTVYAQGSGKVAGKVTNVKTGETITGVTIKVIGTARVGSSDVTGNYNIPAVPAGKYTLEFSYVGFATKQITDVEIKDKDVTTLDVVLDNTGGTVLDQVVVTGTFKKESISALYSQQKNSARISSGISTEQIKRSPDRNTSEAIKRVSGASIQDNKYVIVRGLSDRYNSAMLNNAILPNTEVDKRAFSFDIIPSNLIESIVINKTATPDIPADFSGGVVQVNTKDFPEKNFFDASIGTSYNTQSTFKDFTSAKRAGGEVFGFAGSDREIPKGFPSTKDFQSLQNNSNEIFEYSKLFKNNWGYDTKKSTLTPNFQLNYGSTKNFKDDSKFGAIFSLTYRYDQRKREADQKAYVGQSLPEVFHDDQYSFNTNLGALANFAYSWKSNKISFKNLYNRILENQFTLREGKDDSGSEFYRTGDYLLQRSILTNQLSGEHILSDKSKLKLDWSLNYGRTDRDEPGYKRMEYSKDGIASISATSSSTADRAGNFNSTMTENSYGGALNLTLPIRLFSENDKLKAGYFNQLRDRNFNARVIGFIRNGNFDASLLKLPQDKIFDQANIRPNGFILNEITNGGDHYDAKAFLNAGYLMYDGFVMEKLRVIAGARVESYNLKLNSEDNGNPVGVDTTTISLLPSLNLIYNLDSKQSFRFAASQTVGRQEFREMAPFPFYDFNKNMNVRGNPNLKQSKTSNFDLGYAYYPTAGEVLSVGAFYKYFENPIEQALQLGNSGRSFNYTNSKSADVFGVEAEVRKNLKFIDERLDNFVINANGSYIYSKVIVPTTVNSTGKRKLQGQSPYLINAGLSYTTKNPNTTAITLLYNRVGPRIWAIGNAEDPDIYEYSRNILDLQLAQKFANSRAEVKLNYSDILNNKAYFYQKPKGSDPNAAFNKNTDNINRAEKYGSTVSLTLSYKFW